MSLFIQLLLNGLISGSIYALVAAGFSLIYNTNKFMHFAHGAIVVLAGYLLYGFYKVVGFGFIYSLLSTLFYASFFGLLIYAIVYRPLQKKKASKVILLITSISLLIFFQNVIQMIFGTSVKDLEFNVSEGISVLGATITPLQISIIIISFVLMTGLYFFVSKTRIGRDMRAVADNNELASIVGINYKKVFAISFILGSLLAGIAGVLIALEQNLTPSMGTNLMIKGFTGAVVGGIYSVPASIIGSLFLGLAENFGIAFLPSGYKDAISFVILFLFLLFKPNGLFGGKKER